MRVAPDPPQIASTAWPHRADEAVGNPAQPSPQRRLSLRARNRPQSSHAGLEVAAIVLAEGRSTEACVEVNVGQVEDVVGQRMPELLERFGVAKRRRTRAARNSLGAHDGLEQLVESGGEDSLAGARIFGRSSDRADVSSGVAR